jgi:hypothetical protein
MLAAPRGVCTACTGRQDILPCQLGSSMMPKRATPCPRRSAPAGCKAAGLCQCCLCRTHLGCTLVSRSHLHCIQNTRGWWLQVQWGAHSQHGQAPHRATHPWAGRHFWLMAYPPCIPPPSIATNTSPPQHTIDIAPHSASDSDVEIDGVLQYVRAQDSHSCGTGGHRSLHRASRLGAPAGARAAEQQLPCSFRAPGYTRSHQHDNYGGSNGSNLEAAPADWGPGHG